MKNNKFFDLEEKILICLLTLALSGCGAPKQKLPPYITPLTQTRIRELRPSWSPVKDKSHPYYNKIAYETLLGTYLISVSDGEPEKISGSRSGLRPIWSPDGRKISFYTEYFDLDTKDLKQVGNPKYKNIIVGWSEDSKKVYYQSYREDDRIITCEMLLDTGGERELSERMGIPDMDNLPSPGGKKLLSYRDGKLYLSDPDGSNKEELTEGLWPSWSPDGKKFVFVRSRVIRRQIPFFDSTAPHKTLNLYIFDLGKYKQYKKPKSSEPKRLRE